MAAVCKLYDKQRDQFSRLGQMFKVSMNEFVISLWLIYQTVHHARLAETAWGREQDITHSELFPDKLNEPVTAIAIPSPDRRTDDVSNHKLHTPTEMNMFYNKYIIQQICFKINQKIKINIRY